MCILVDTTHLFFRNLHMNMQKIMERNPASDLALNEDGIPNRPIDPMKDYNLGYLSHLVCQNILSFAVKFGASRVNRMILAIDSKPSWRHHFYVENSKQFEEYRNETYKGDRTKDDDIPWKEIYEIYDYTIEQLRLYSDFEVVEIPLAEADDIIAVAAKYFKPYEQVTVISSDKDFRQLQDEPRVNQYDPIKQNFIPKINVEHYKKMHIIVAGDDNIKAIKPRTGEKTAEKMIPELDILLQTNPGMKARYEFNRTLIDFDYIPTDLAEKIVAVLESPQFNYNPTGLLKLCQKYRLNAIADRMNQFKLGVQPIKTKWNTYYDTLYRQKQLEQSTLEDFFS